MQVHQTAFVSLRNRRWLVEGVTQSTFNGLGLTCIDDDAGGEALTVVADAEIGLLNDEADSWSAVAQSGTDDPEAFRAYIRSLTWRTSTAADRNLFQSPFRAGIRMSAYQLVPLKKALQLPRGRSRPALLCARCCCAGASISSWWRRRRDDDPVAGGA